MKKQNCASSQYMLMYGQERIPFDLTYSERKRLTVHVEPNQTVHVLAPTSVPFEQVMARLQRRAGWISRQREYFEEFIPLPPAKRFVNGETHRYLGRQYRLKIVQADASSVKLKGRFIHIATPQPTKPATVEVLLTNWYREHAWNIFQRRMDGCLKTSCLRQLGQPPLLIRKMKKRWGSCTKDGTILLNLNLVKTPLDCIEYVIMHELCHLKIHEHSPKYYELLTRCMPDWERRKDRLNSIDWNLS